MDARWRKIICGIAVACFALLVAWSLLLLGWWNIDRKFERIWEQEKRPKLAAAAGAAQPLLDALEAYKRDNGRYPEELEQLVPKYLDEVPEPRKPLYPPLKFLPLDDGEEFMLFAEAPQNYSGGFLPPGSAEQLVYESDRTYHHDPWSVEMGDPRNREPLERIDGWAYYAYHHDLL
jgi:hypothetical protein